MDRRGFTLVETLVIVGLVAVLAILVGLLVKLPELQEQQRTARCLSNLRQMHAAMRMYLDDNDDRFPFAGRDAPHAPMVDVWAGLRRYASSPDIFLCETDSSPFYTARWVRRNGAGRIQEKEITVPSSYGYPQVFYHSL